MAHPHKGACGPLPTICATLLDLVEMYQTNYAHSAHAGKISLKAEEIAATTGALDMLHAFNNVLNTEIYGSLKNEVEIPVGSSKTLRCAH